MMKEVVLFEYELDSSVFVQQLERLHRTGELTEEELQALAGGIFVLDAEDILVRVVRTVGAKELKDYLWSDLRIELASHPVLVLNRRARSILDRHKLLPTKCLEISLNEAVQRFTEIREVEYEGLDYMKFKSRPLGAGVFQSVIDGC